MLQVARLAPTLLGDSAPLVADFLRARLNADGGFADRAGVSDLYYTVFGLEGLLALRADLPAARVAPYLASYGDGDGLDLVHLCCLCRCWASLGPQWRDDVPRQAIFQRIERHRSADGGYHASPASASGTIYGCFLASGACQDMGIELPFPDRLLQCIDSLRCEDGAYANQADMPIGLTAATAAAVALRRQYGAAPQASVARWLLAQAMADGGFKAAPQAPMPDLLSTATALHALAGLQANLTPLREPCLDFIDTLWTNAGGFHGNWEDDALDCEYTYYGLLALGHLSLA